KGGALLLNAGPKPDGELPIEQEERLREMALWYSFNKEAVDNVRPWIIPNEENIWYSRKGNDVYAYLTKLGTWERGNRKSFVLGSVKATKDTKILVVGQSGLTIAGREINKNIEGTYSQENDGLHISVLQAYRPYSNNKWSNPVVVKITNAEPAIIPLGINTVSAEKISGVQVLFKGELPDLAGTESVEAGFQYRVMPEYGEEVNVEGWLETKYVKLAQKGEFAAEISDLKMGPVYQYRAMIKHPLVKLYGDIKRFNSK
ncbi:MAG: alpha-L-fucosidase, partial [Ignavibacteria bacterium]|nr:alpha-L-fucosidase [Ignavibacteria bacterium]